MANHPLTVYLRGHYAGGHTALRRLREQATSDPTNDRRTFLSALAAEIELVLDGSGHQLDANSSGNRSCRSSQSSAGATKRSKR
jgi:hypothetical protein